MSVLNCSFLKEIMILVFLLYVLVKATMRIYLYTVIRCNLIRARAVSTVRPYCSSRHYSYYYYSLHFFCIFRCLTVHKNSPVFGASLRFAVTSKWLCSTPYKCTKYPCHWGYFFVGGRNTLHVFVMPSCT